MAGLLIRLVNDLMHDDRVRRRFNAEPFEVMTEYGLSPRARQALHTMDRPTIGAYIKEEFEQWSFPPWDVEESDAECQAIIAGGVVGAAYPDPAPQVYSIAPTNAAGAPVQVTVRGEGFSKDATLTLVGPGGNRIAATGVKVSGTYRCAHLDATVNLAGAPAGQYAIEIKINPNDPQFRRTLPVLQNASLTVA